MQDMFGSVRRSLVFRSPDNGDEGVGGRIVDKIGSYIRRSMVMSRSLIKDSTPQIRWRKGELIGCGAFGRVYMGMNLDSGELLAVKQVLIASNHASKEKAQDHVRELEEEVKLLKNLSHPNIVRYLGTVREDDTLNILLEFVPGGSISSLLGKFGSFPEAVIRMYTKQILLGLEYLHKNNIIHRDIKGANILVDNKGCIKLADFGASKKVVQLATMTGAKSMKGTPYWMAPEVIRQTGHTFSADIWSVGCTVIEMATGKPPWSQQFQEVAALFHIGTTMSHPPIPEHLSPEAKDFLLQCLQKEANLRPSASVLLKHPFVTGECQETAMLNSSASENSPYPILKTGSNFKNSPRMTHGGSKDVCHISKVSCSTMYLDKSSETLPVWETNTSDDEMCQIYDKDDFPLSGSVKSNPCLVSSGFKSFNPMDEPLDDGQNNFESPEPERRGINSDASHQIDGTVGSCGTSGDGFNFHNQSVSEDDDEVTETKIRAFLDEKALDLKKLQTEFYNTLNGSSPSAAVRNVHGESSTSYLNLPPKSRSPSRVASGTPTIPVNAANKTSPGNCSRRESNVGGIDNKNMQDAPMQPVSEWKGLLVSQEQPINPSFEEKSRKWKEELDQELERKRELMRQAGVGVKTSSPKDRANFPRDRSRFASPGR